MNPASDLFERVAKLDKRISFVEVQREVLRTRLTKLEKDCADLNDEIVLVKKAEEALLHLSTTLLGQSTESIDTMITRGLQAIFDDQTLEFRTVLTKQRGKTNARFELFEDGHSAPLMSSYGGGVLCVIGVLLRIMTIFILKMRRVVFLDETLAHLSAEYIPNLSSFLRTLCDELDFEIIMVTHQPEFATNATTRFLASTKNGSLHLEKVDE